MKKKKKMPVTKPRKDDEWILWADDRSTEIEAEMKRNGTWEDITPEEEERVRKRTKPLLRKFFNKE